MLHFRVPLLLTVIVIQFPLMAVGQPVEFKEMAFLVGEWEYKAKSLLPDGTYQPQEFYSKVSYVEGGFAIKDDFHFKNQNGEWVLYGSTIRSYDKKAQKWKMLWYNYDLSFVTQMEGEFKNGEFHFTGMGTDEKGDYMEKIVFYDITDDQYSWKGDKSYDMGRTWLKNFFAYTAFRKQ